MQISWFGEAGFRLQGKDATLIIDPPAASTGFSLGRPTADILALTQKDGRDAGGVYGEPFLIDSPGEYERKGVFVYGLHIPSEPKRLHFRIEMEEMSFGHIADLDHPLEAEEIAQLEGVDILFVPVGGKTVLGAERATALISQIEPRIVVPMQYSVKGAKRDYAPVDQFLKEIGAKNVEPMDKWKIVKKDLPTDDTQTIVLTVG